MTRPASVTPSPLPPPSPDAGGDRVVAFALGLAVVLFTLHRSLVPMAETDLLFHLTLGEHILDTGHIPFRNLYSFTWPDHPDLDLSWAFQVLVALLYRVGGFPGIVVGKTALVVGAAWLLYAVCRRSGGGPALSALVTALAITAADQRMCERPHLVTWVGLGALQWLLLAAEQGRPRLLAWIPALVAVWANFHAGVFLAALILGLRYLGARLEGRRPPGGVWLPLLSVAACVLTPAGLRLLPYLAWHTGLGSTRIIEEFRVADAWDDPWFFLLLGAVALALFRLRREVTASQVLPVLVIALLAWRSVRFVAEWSLVAAPLVVTGFAGLHRALVGAPRDPELGPPLGRFDSRRWRRGLRVAAQAAALLVIGGTVVAERRGNPLSLGLAADIVPFEAIDFVTRNGLRDRLYHDLDVGCYLLWEGWPRYRVFQDARLPAYPDEFHRALDQTPLDPAAWGALLDRYGVDAALINYPGINIRAGSFDPETWALVYRSDDALVFARRIPRHAEVIARNEIPLRVRFTLAAGSTVEPLHRPLTPATAR